MNLSSSIYYPEQVEEAIKQGFDDLIIHPKALSRFGQISLGECLTLIPKLQMDSCHVSVQIDLIDDLTKVERNNEFLFKLVKDYGVPLRIINLGLGKWLRRKFWEVKLFFILEKGCRNHLVLESLIEQFSSSFYGCSFPIEVPFSTIEKWATQLPGRKELLLIGPLVMSWSKRSLVKRLKNNFQISSNVFYEKADVESTQFQNQNKMMLLENKAGSFTFHECDFSILGHLEYLKKNQLFTHLRIDPIFLGDEKYLGLIKSTFLGEKHKDHSALKLWPRPLTDGFSFKNLSHEKFKELKNKVLNDRNSSLLGTIEEAQKGSHLILWVHKSFHIDKHVYFLNPLGVSIEYHLTWAKTLEGSEVKELQKGKIYILPYKKGILCQSQLFLKRNKDSNSID